MCRHGVLLSDRGAAFLSNLMQEVCEILGVKKNNTTAYHPQTDGLVERFNRTLCCLNGLIEMHSKKCYQMRTNSDYRLFRPHGELDGLTRGRGSTVPFVEEAIAIDN